MFHILTLHSLNLFMNILVRIRLIFHINNFLILKISSENIFIFYSIYRNNFIVQLFGTIKISTNNFHTLVYENIFARKKCQSTVYTFTVILCYMHIHTCTHAWLCYRGNNLLLKFTCAKPAAIMIITFQCIINIVCGVCVCVCCVCVCVLVCVCVCVCK